jgi:hypothetical protein
MFLKRVLGHETERSPVRVRKGDHRVKLRRFRQDLNYAHGENLVMWIALNLSWGSAAQQVANVKEFIIRPHRFHASNQLMAAARSTFSLS